MAAADTTNAAALKKVLNLGLMGLAGGAGLKAILGFKDMLSRPGYERRKTPNPAVVEIGIPANKMANEGSSAPAPFVPDVHLSPDGSNVPTYAKPGLLDWLAGRTHIDMMSKPWFLPAAIGVPTLGAYAGYSAVDHATEALKKKEREDELEKAKGDYRKTLMEQYTDGKTAAAKSDFDKDLDELVELVKSASSLNDWAGFGAGGYITLASALAALTGKATYDWAKTQAPDERLAKAVKTRERLRWATRPPEIYAVTKALQPKKQDKSFNIASPDEQNDIAKVAAWYKP
jgi:hypothetical protein